MQMCELRMRALRVQAALQRYWHPGQLNANGIQGATVPPCIYLNVYPLLPPMFPVPPLPVLRAPSLVFLAKKSQRMDNVLSCLIILTLWCSI